MKTISVISKHSGCGQTMIVVNLASGLKRKGHRVLIIDSDPKGKIPDWLGINQKRNKISDADNKNLTISNSRLGMDLLSYAPESSDNTIIDFPASDMLAYDYVLIHPINYEDFRLLNRITDAVIVCTDLSHTNELEEFKALEQCMHDSTGKENCIKLILPNKINTKEWEHNSRQLFALAYYVGFERIADPIPYCERIHDLPSQRHTVWELRQENIKDAFMRLVEAVENI